jgi:hypothetical protein
MLVCYWRRYVNEKNNLEYCGFWICWAGLWKCERINCTKHNKAKKVWELQRMFFREGKLRRGKPERGKSGI